jgi:hypothetical protein
VRALVVYVASRENLDRDGDVTITHIKTTTTTTTTTTTLLTQI